MSLARVGYARAIVALTASRRAVLSGVLGLALLLTGCGGSGAGSSTTATKRPAKPARTPPAIDPRLTYRSLYSLPAPLRDPATAALGGGRFVMLGGLDGADVSSAGILVADRQRVLHTGALPGPQHDAQAAALAGKVYVFGGGYTTELDHILSYDPVSGAVGQAGALSVAQSDVAVAQAGGTAYIVGGYDGTTYLNTIVAWHPGSAPQVQAHLPVGLRYAAVAVADASLLVLGGSTPEAASDAIYRFDLVTHRVRRIGTLPAPDHPRQRRHPRGQRLPDRRPRRSPQRPDRRRLRDRSRHRPGSGRRTPADPDLGCGGDHHRSRHPRGRWPVTDGDAERGRRTGPRRRALTGPG